jgi:hypothetical protein
LELHRDRVRRRGVGCLGALRLASLPSRNQWRRREGRASGGGRRLHEHGCTRPTGHDHPPRPRARAHAAGHGHRPRALQRRQDAGLGDLERRIAQRERRDRPGRRVPARARARGDGEAHGEFRRTRWPDGARAGSADDRAARGPRDHAARLRSGPALRRPRRPRGSGCASRTRSSRRRTRPRGPGAGA